VKPDLKKDDYVIEEEEEFEPIAPVADNFV
jgi:hypothetical protein